MDFLSNHFEFFFFACFVNQISLGESVKRLFFLDHNFVLSVCKWIVIRRLYISAIALIFCHVFIQFAPGKVQN